MDRRTMIRRTALVGGSLVWATPVVQSLGGAAFATTTGGSPKPPDKEGNAPSNVVLLLLCPDGYHQVKFDAGFPEPSCGPKEDPPIPADARKRWNDLTASYNILEGCAPVTGDASDVNSPICVNYSGCELILWGVFDGGGDGGNQVFFVTTDPIPSGFFVDHDVANSTICFGKTF